ncbi:unnamed protein product [Prunus armeniaca]|uniref:Alkyl hydroperoxide reductase subunit C/ Thiol specific antioxidant domain-containing protein n=1 Tax=Prunus armeniaca TaxID=36596 RepID=A0A6J5VIT3_PRUAR|nr:unnamed protein product [Prunus armeniaca]CAB4318470.1 unnamed protein product [Prunus armeniaca]
MKMEESQGKECKSLKYIGKFAWFVGGHHQSKPWAFAKKYKLPSTLLSDEGNKVRKWGVPSDLFGTLPGRQIQLIYNNQFQPEKHIDETLKLLQSL